VVELEDEVFVKNTGSSFLEKGSLSGEFTGKRILVIGAARQGIALARYLVRHGASVILNDRLSEEDLEEAHRALEDLDIEWVHGGHPLELLRGTDMVCVSGGVPLTIELVAEARRQGIPVTNDSQIFLERTPCQVIGITGSAGKTTTTTLVGRVAELGWFASPRNPTQTTDLTLMEPGTERSGKVWVGGNIGTPLVDRLDEMHPGDLAVVEFSSFQLEIMDRSPEIAAVLNITPNHLDRHKTMEAYRAAKANILLHQSKDGIAILNRDDPGSWSLAPLVQGDLFSFGLEQDKKVEAGVFLSEDRRTILYRNPRLGISSPQPILPVSAIELRGTHNLANVLATCAIALAARLPVSAIGAAIKGFRGVEHRLEFVGRWKGVDWYNDSIATAPERAMAAIRSFSEPLVLLSGGRDKDLPWDDFARLVHEKVKHIILFGEAGPKISQALAVAKDRSSLDVTLCQTLLEAVHMAAKVSAPGDVVLLAPGGASFDEFRDFEDRGEAFKRWVKELQ
jgi:UDP-N-acetylmuramoylalanine--D-glutamate ligase